MTPHDPLRPRSPRSVQEATAWVRSQGTSIWPAEVGTGDDLVPRLDGTSVLLSLSDGGYIVAFYERGAYRQAVRGQDESAAVDDFVRPAQPGSGRRDGGVDLPTWRPGGQPGTRGTER